MRLERQRMILGGIGCVLLLFGSANAQWQRDVRLQRTVSLWQKGLPLSTVVHKIQQQIGVPLQLGIGIPNMKLHLFVRQKKARDVLEGLAMLLNAGDIFQAQWVTKGNGYILEVKRIKDVGEGWKKFLRSLLDALPHLAEGKTVTLSFNGISVQGINDPWASPRWRFVASLSPAQKEQLLKNKSVTINPNSLTPSQRDTLETALVKSFPDLPPLSNSSSILVGLQSWPSYAPAILIATEFNGESCFVVTPIVKGFEKKGYRLLSQ